MSVFQPTTLVTLYAVAEDTDADDYGDDTGTGEVLVEDVPASVVSSTVNVRNATGGQGGTVRVWTARLPHDAPAVADGRLLDQDTGHTYAIDEVTRGRGAAGLSPLRLALSRVDP